MHRTVPFAPEYCPVSRSILQATLHITDFPARMPSFAEFALLCVNNRCITHCNLMGNKYFCIGIARSWQRIVTNIHDCCAAGHVPM